MPQESVMTSRQRLDAAYRCQPTDRVPIFVRGVSDTRPPHDSYAPLRKLVCETCDLKWGWSTAEVFPAPPTTRRVEPYDDDFDLVTTVMPTPRGELTHQRLVGRKGQPGMTRKHWLAGRDDALRYMSLPPPEPTTDAAGFFALRDQVGERGIVEAHLAAMNPGGHVAELFGSEAFAFLSIEDRGLVHELLEHVAQRALRAIDWLLARDVGPYFAVSGQEFVAPPLHGPRDFWDFNVRYDKRLFARVRDAGGLVHVHCHGSLKGLLGGFVEAGANVLHPVEAPPMGNVAAAEAKAVLRGKVCIEGNVQVGDLFTLPPAEIERQVEALIRDAGPTGLIVAPTASPYAPVATRRMLANYKRMVRAALRG
ncbi:MAG TPA: uroporphyrinogen decarboxylase family protein [Planctomycetota bacterium]|nr:uroporphyrinogen decarboxylase family protein [Planctomycetota bacterium]